MYQNVEELKEKLRTELSLQTILNELFSSENLLKDFQDNPFEILKMFLKHFKDGDYLDMSSETWNGLSTEKQQKYASFYQKWYAQEKGLPVEKMIYTQGIELEMCLIPPGRYWQGTDSSKLKRENEKRRKVLLHNGFWCGKYPVTQNQWFSLIDYNPSHFQGGNKPVENLSWEDCQKFCKKANLELLTEAHWEYACRAGVTDTYYFGGDSSKLVDYAWYSINSEKETHPVGKKKANSFGLYDMYGNVWEWCQDFYKSEYGKNATNPLVENLSNEENIARGGCWINLSNVCRSAYRYNQYQYRHDFTLGFRVAKIIID